MEELFTVGEVAERLKVPPRTVKRWLVTGQLHGLKAGRKWRVTPSAIEQFLQESIKDHSPHVIEKVHA